MQQSPKEPLLTLIERLKIEERHEQLLNILPLYGKIALALIPSLRSSIDYFSSHHHRRDESNPESPAEDKSPEEIDVALALGEKEALNSFLNNLTTALFCSSSELPKTAPSTPPDLAKSPKIKIKIGKGGKADRNVDESLNLGAAFTFPVTPESLDNGNTRFHHNVDDSNDDITKLHGPNIEENLDNESRDSASTNISTSSHSQGSTDTAETIPLESEMTPWQKSVFQKINFVSRCEHTLFKYTTEIRNDDPSFEKLPWLIAKKLKEIFKLLDDDEFQGVFQSWLARDALLLGNVYLTSESLCFYSLLPGALSKDEEISPDVNLYEGALGYKLGHYGDSYYSLVATHNFWVILKSQNLCIYPSATKLFFPVKVIDLRDALYCEIVADSSFIPSPRGENNSECKLPKISSFTLLLQLESEASSISEEAEDPSENFQGGVWFRVVCIKKSYKFYTKNIFSARHWCNAITKEIFHLHNANSKREVLLKIPLERIHEFRKNYILAEKEEDAAADNDIPVVFTVKYDPGEEVKSSGATSPTSDHGSFDLPEFAHFVLFGQGTEMQETMSKLLKMTRNRSQEKDPHGALSKRADITPILSTLRPNLEKGVSIIDKVALINEEFLTSDEREKYIPKSGGGDSLFLKKKKGSKSNNSSVANSPGTDMLDAHINDDLESEDVIDGFNWQFPKPFYILTLKSLNLHISTEKKDAAEMEKHYANLMEEPKNPTTMENATKYSESSEFEYSESLAESSKTGSSFNSSGYQSLSDRSSVSAMRKIKNIYPIGKGLISDPQHYDTSPDDLFFVKSVSNRSKDLKKFQRRFLLGSDTELVASYHAFLQRKIPVYGKLYLGTEKLYFRSLVPGVATKMILPLKKLEELQATSGSVVRAPGLNLSLHGGESLSLLFGSQRVRDDCKKMILNQIPSNSKFQQKKTKELCNKEDKSVAIESDPVSLSKKKNTLSEDLANRRVRAARLRLLEDRICAASGIVFPIILAEDPIFLTEVRSSVSYRFTLLTIGSRGDVQPYIALGKGLMAEGHVVTIATHLEFKHWIMSHGLNFKEVAGNPAELMALMVKHGSMSVGFFKEASGKFRGWVSQLLATSWEACQDTDVLIESPSAMGGLHIAEALGIPYMRAFTMPWTRTRAYPHAFVVPDQKRGGSYNILTHVMFETVFWKGISGQVNKWRTESLGLKKTSLVKMQQSQIPFLYNVSPEVFPPAVDFPDWVKVTGYWFLDEGSNDYTPPEGLVKFLQKAREDKKKIVYVGFGSIVVSDSNSLTQAVVDAVLALGLRCVLNKGWSDKLSKEKSKPEVQLPAEIFNISLVPHDWLFPKIDVAVHHGGSGTTGATLRSGLPTIIKPFFGDQFFYASRIEELGLGIALKKLNAKTFTNALKVITTDDSFTKKARAMSQNINCESGVLSAIGDIYSEFAYAKSLMDNIRLNNDLRPNNDDDSAISTHGGASSRFDRSLNNSEEDLKIDKVTLG